MVRLAGDPALKPIETGYLSDKERRIKAMFDAIAPRYDLLNDLLSFRQHRYWRKLAVKLAKIRPGDVCLDVCTGTGMFAAQISAVVGKSGKVVGTDFSIPMMLRADCSTKHGANGTVRMTAGNAEHLSFPDNCFNAVTVGFGVRNVNNVRAAISEMMRVVVPEGAVVILEFTKPDSRRKFVNFYLSKVLPQIGGLLSRKEAYTYLPESMKEFLNKQEMSACMAEAGLINISVKELNFGTVCIHTGFKPAINPKGLKI